MVELYWKTLADLKEPAILWRLFVPFAAAIVLVSLLGYGLFGVLLFSDWVTQNTMVVEFTTWSQNAENTIGSIPLIGGLLLWIIGFVVTLVAGVLGFLLGSYLVLLFAMVITGFMTDSLVKAVHDKHYPHTPYSGHGSIGGMLWKLTKFGLLMLLLFLVTIPMLFIPLVNIIWFWLLGFLFFRYSVVLDVGQVILPEALFNQVKGLGNGTSTLTLAGFFALSLLPILSLFAPVLAVIALAHYYFDMLSSQPQTVVKTDVN
ncbi:MAG: EI24 domain-containing protein [Gammaproteobacteria bacterium]|nr:EI24 domain-containing protein [Gammaproteobacteria bacterium]MBD3776454.1 EI24 domain-containing protein [Thiotrichales bacterium]